MHGITGISMEYKFEQPVVGKIGTEKYACTIQWRNGQLIADEDKKIGGQDSGPDPTSLLLSSIASSVLIMLRIYIDSKGWDILEITVSVNSYEEILKGKMVTYIDRDVRFNTPIEEERKTILLEIAKNCPITQLIENGIYSRTFIFRDGDTQKSIDYSNEKLTVTWKPEYCQHSSRCWKQLPTVFDPTLKKWINVDGASTEKIIQQVKSCPSGALSIRIAENPQ
jgi:putative redox protein